MLAVCGAGLVLASCGEVSEASRRPNVLLLLVDDLGYHDLGATGSTFYETSHIDRLAGRSVTFTQGYACSRVCSPSRASLLLGQYTPTHGITDWIGALSGEAWRGRGRHDRMLPADYVRSLPQAPTTLAEAFQDAGYATFFAGKWHLGGEGSGPTDHGFGINIGGWAKGGPRGGYFAPFQNPALPDGPDGESLTLRLADETAAWVSAHPDTPFFAMLSFYAVHAPLQTTAARWRTFREKAATQGIAPAGFRMGERLPERLVQDDPVYAGMVASVDEAVGRVMRSLDAAGLRQNTVVVFTSDHGGVSAGDNYATTNAPRRGGKGQDGEGGLRVPFLIAAPEATAGRKVDAPVTHADLYPSLLELCGVGPPPGGQLEGRSLAPRLVSVDTLPERALYWHYPHYGHQGGAPSSVMRRGPWKLMMHHEDGRLALHHLGDDPVERRDVAAAQPGLVAELAAELNAYVQSREARFPVPDPAYDARAQRARLRRLEDELLPQLEEGRKERLAEAWAPGADWWGSGR